MITTVARISLWPPRYAAQTSRIIGRSRRAWNFSRCRRYDNELLLEGRDFDLQDDDDRQFFEAAAQDLLTQSHEFVFPVVRVQVVETPEATEKGNFAFSAPVRKRAQELGFDIEDPEDLALLTATGRSRGNSRFCVRADIERAVATKQARASQVPPRVDPKGQDAVSGELPRTVVESGLVSSTAAASGNRMFDPAPEELPAAPPPEEEPLTIPIPEFDDVADDEDEE